MDVKTTAPRPRIPTVRPPVGNFLCTVLLLGAACSVTAAQQPNSPPARLRFNGLDGPPWPIAATVLPGQSLQIEVRGASNAPFIVAASTGLVPGSGWVLGGILDLDPAALGIVVDGFTDPAWNTGPAGIHLSSNLIAPSTPLGASAGFQGAVADPTSPFGGTLTAATQVTVAQAPSTTGLLLIDNGFAYVDLAPLGVQVPIYDLVFSGFFVASNGMVTFGAPSVDRSPTSAEFAAEMPRAAMLWCDLDPGAGGQVTWTFDPTTPLPTVSVDWTAVPYGYNAPGTATVHWSMITGVGDMTISSSAWTSWGAYDSIVGVTPGRSLSQTPSLDLSILATGGFQGAPLQMIHEWFGLPSSQPNYGLSSPNPYDLFGQTLHFSAMSVGTQAANYFLY